MQANTLPLTLPTSTSPCKKLPQELVLIDAYLAKWAKWVGHQLAFITWPRTSIAARMMELHELGLSREKLFPYAGQDKAPEGCMLIDTAVARLPEKLKRCLFIEYFGGGVLETKAKQAKLPIFAYRERLRCALWHIHGQISHLC
jgi:hypothetical protein